MIFRNLIRHLLGWRTIVIFSNLSLEKLCSRLEKVVTPNAPRGFFVDWPNNKPFMGKVDTAGFCLREKAKIGQGMAANMYGEFYPHKGITTISVLIYPTTTEMIITSVGFLLICSVGSTALFSNGAPSDPITLSDRAFILGSVGFILFGIFSGDNYRKRRIFRKLSELLC